MGFELGGTGVSPVKSGVPPDFGCGGKPQWMRRRLVTLPAQGFWVGCPKQQAEGRFH